MHVLFTNDYTHKQYLMQTFSADFTEMIDEILSTVDDTIFGECIAIA